MPGGGRCTIFYMAQCIRVVMQEGRAWGMAIYRKGDVWSTTAI